MVIFANLLGFGILFLESPAAITENLYYPLALLGIVLIAYICIVFFSMGDEYLFLIVSMLLTIGIIMLFRLDHAQAVRQIIWFYVGMAIYFLLYIIYRRATFWKNLFPAYALLAFCLFTATLLFGRVSGGAKNWLFGFQPSEPIKTCASGEMPSDRSILVLRPIRRFLKGSESLKYASNSSGKDV